MIHQSPIILVLVYEMFHDMLVYIFAYQSCSDLPGFEFVFAIESSHLLPLLLSKDGQVGGDVEDVVLGVLGRSSHVNDLVVTTEVSHQISGSHVRDHIGVTLCQGLSRRPEGSPRTVADSCC